MSQSYRLKLSRAALKLKVATRIPAQFTASSPLELDRTSGTYALSLDLDALQTSLDPIYVPMDFTQTGTGAEAVTLDSIFRGKLYTPEMFGATTVSADAGYGIQLAINAAGAVGGAVRFGPGTYTVITPIVDTLGVWIEGDDQLGSILSFTPASDNLICYRVRNAGNIVTGGGIRNMKFYAPRPAVAVTSISNASPAVITVANTLVADTPVNFSTTGTLPTGLSLNTTYYVSAAGLSSSSFQVSATVGGASINTSSAGSGTHSYAVAYTKTAIEIEDVSQFTIDNVYINGGTAVSGVGNFWSGGVGSIGIRTKGREFIRVRNIVAYCDRPCVISPNPNSTIDIDFSEFDQLDLVANNNPGLEIEDAVNYTRLSLTNIHVAHATHGIYHHDTTSTILSQGLSIRNFGCEQGTSATAYNIYIKKSTTAFAQNVDISGFQSWDNACRGIFLQNVKNVSIANAFFQGAGEIMAVDNTVHNLNWKDCNFQIGTTALFGGQKKVWATEIVSGIVLPRSAQYQSSVSPADAVLAVGTGIAIEGATSGRATITPQAVAGSAVLTLPTNTGTFAVSATAPLAVSATTGNLTLDQSSMAITGGTIDGTVIGGTTAANGTFVTLGATTGNITTVASTTVGATTGNFTTVNATNIAVTDKSTYSNGATAFNTTSIPSIYATAASGSYPWESAGRLVLQSRGTGADREMLFVTGATPAIRGGISGTASGRFMGTQANAAGAVSELAVIKTGIANNTATALFTVTVPNANHNAAIFLDIAGFLGTGTDASESTRCAAGSIAIARTTGVATVAVASALSHEQIATVAGGGTLTLAYGVSAMSGAVGATQTFTVTMTLVVTGTITDHSAVVHARLLNGAATGITMAP